MEMGTHSKAKIPPPTMDQEWIMNKGKLWLRWFKRAALPMSFANILQKIEDEEENVPEESDSNDEYSSDSKDSDYDQTVSLIDFPIAISSNFNI